MYGKYTIVGKFRVNLVGKVNIERWGLFLITTPTFQLPPKPLRSIFLKSLFNKIGIILNS